MAAAPLADFDSEEWNEFHDLGDAPAKNLSGHSSSPCTSKPHSSFCSAGAREWGGRIRRYKQPPGPPPSTMVSDCNSDLTVRSHGRENDIIKLADPDSVISCPVFDVQRGGGQWCSGGEKCGIGEMEEADGVEDGYDEEAVLLSGSLEDLVNTFDDQVTKCCHDYGERVERIAPVQIRRSEPDDEATGIRQSQSWWTLTGDYGNLLPINWLGPPLTSSRSQGGVASQGIGTFRCPRSESEDVGTDSYDDSDSEEKEEEELLFTNEDLCEEEEEKGMGMGMSPLAEDVIEELEAMMEEDNDDLSGSEEAWLLDHSSLISSPIGQQSEQDCLSRSDWSSDDYVKHLPSAVLRTLLVRLTTSVEDLRSAWCHEVCRSEELRYRKQLHEEFIRRMISIEGKIINNSSLRRKEKSRTRSVSTGQYLTTVVPYKHEAGCPPTVEELQIYTKILAAIDEDSPTVPGLLTDYILRVLCPTQ